MNAQLPTIVKQWSALKRARSRSALLSGAALAGGDLDSEMTYTFTSRAFMSPLTFFIRLSSTERTMTSLVQKSHLVGEAVAKSSEGLSRIRHKSQLISNHVDDANRIMRRMYVCLRSFDLQPSSCFACRRSLLSLEHALAVAGFTVRTYRPNLTPSACRVRSGTSISVLMLAMQILMFTCGYIISKRI